MTPILFKIGSLNVYTYGTFLVLALICSSILLYRLASKKNRKTEAVFDLVIFGVLIGLIFARITYFFTYRTQFFSYVDMFKIWQGGLVSWGGLVAAILAFIIIVKLYREPLLEWLDMLGISSLLGLAVGRLGSFISGELAGKSTNLPIAVQGVFPVTLIEAVALFIVFFILWRMIENGRIKKNGGYFIFSLLLYCFVRFALDFLRTDQIYKAGMTMTQVISAAIIVLIILYLAVGAMISKKGANYARS